MSKKKEFGSGFVITNEKDKCLFCDRKIYKDKFITQTKDGFICYKCKQIKKGDICLVKDFQEFGNVLFLCFRRCLTNTYGEKLSNPIWEGIIIDAEDKRLRDIWHRRFLEDNYFLGMSFEKNLIKEFEVAC